VRSPYHTSWSETGRRCYGPAVSDSLSIGERIWFAWVCFFKVLFDGRFAKRALSASTSTSTSTPTPTPTQPPTDALQLLALLQREGRLIDFLEQDIAPFSDADVASAARVVHDGCRKALHARAELAPIRSDEEGAKVTLLSGFSAAENRLVGDVRGEPPYTGTLRHRGWRVKGLSLPTAVTGHDASVVAPAEIEL
jgi:Domain of unknown function (DUF2760)